MPISVRQIPYNKQARVGSCYLGDVREGLREFTASGIKARTCITSPPYWGLRDYGTAKWKGGDPEHEHDRVLARNGRGGSGAPGKQTQGSFPSDLPAATCSCGAIRQDLQIGLEPTITEYVNSLVDVFGLVRDVLTDDGTLWLNLGDSYANDTKWGGSTGGKHVSALHGTCVGRGKRSTGLKSKDMCGIPWHVAFALQADGWYLRSDIIWHKKNPMPESVIDRPTKSHEYVFLFSKMDRYYYDAKAVAEPAKDWTRGGPGVGIKETFHYSPQNGGNNGLKGIAGRYKDGFAPATRNRRSVWSMATEPYRGAHFAVMPTALVAPCVLAGSNVGDVVLDPFMGSGTTAKVAHALNRRWIGIELNPLYIEMQKRRIHG